MLDWFKFRRTKDTKGCEDSDKGDDKYLVFSIHTVELPALYRIFWILRTFVDNYVAIVCHNLRYIRFGNVFKSLSIVVTGFIYAYQTLFEDYNTLEEDIYIFEELKELFPQH